MDALTLISKVITRVAEKCGSFVPTSQVPVDEAQRTELLIETLASHLLGFLGIGGPVNGTLGQASKGDLERICATQIARNNALARALGACDCWGELASCETCGGRGMSGWRPPDMASFNVLVRPVIRRMTHYNLRVQRHRGVRATGESL